MTLSGNTASPGKDEPQAASTEEKKESTLPWRGTIFFFDQSMTTQTAHLETSPQLSYVPLYEWWFSFRPQYYITDKLYVWARFDLTKELTNNQETTLYREDVFGDIWTDLRYATPVPVIHKDFKLSTAVRALWPTSKESQAKGVYVNAGIAETATQKVTINGDSAKFLNAANFKLGAWYTHPFSRATTATNSNIAYSGMSTYTEDRGFVSTDQMVGQPLTNHQLSASIHGDLQITPKLNFGLDFIWINHWHYSPQATASIPVAGGSASVPPSPGQTNFFTQDTWFIANLGYDLFDEMSLSLGYYNLASELSPNSQQRGIVGANNVWWSPGARVFFDVTVNLDKLYELATKKDSGGAKAAQEQRKMQRVGTF